MKEQIEAKIYWYLNFPSWESILLFLGTLILFLLYNRLFSNKRSVYLCVLWSCCLTVIFSITFLGRQFDMAENSVDKIFLTYQLLVQGKTNAWYEILFNVILFVPWGILCSIEKRLLSKSLVLGMLFSLGIEMTQLFTGVGLFEVCDLINNTVGIIIGYILYTAISYLTVYLKKNLFEF